jgi:hypothetical protein
MQCVIASLMEQLTKNANAYTKCHYISPQLTVNIFVNYRKEDLNPQNVKVVEEPTTSDTESCDD